MRPPLTPVQSPRPRAESLTQVQTDSHYTTPHKLTQSFTEQKVLHHMAQSSRSPIGVQLFWESGANPQTEWPAWIATFKMAVMAQHNVEVEKLLRLKPARTELFYPAMPTLEDEFENETQDEARQREQRNEKRRVDWENECKAIETKGPTVDRIHWDEADMKVKSLLYLSLGAEACRTFHQRNPHTKIDRYSTHELVHELALTFTRPRYITFDRYQLFTSKQHPHESLENFYSRLREAGSHCRFDHLEEEIIKDLFISNMTNIPIQMDLLSEVRTPQQVLNYAINRERGQANQQEILKTKNTSIWNQVNYMRQNRKPAQPLLPTPTSGKIEPCWKCGNPFIPNHLQNCPAKNTICKICKKQGHFSSLCKAPMPERRRPPLQSTSYTPNRHQNSNTPRTGQNQTRRVRHIKNNTETLHSEDEPEQEEEVDAEAALYITELTEDWANVNLIQPSKFHTEKNSDINKDGQDEFWVETSTNNKQLSWLADTGSPKSFMNVATAKEVLQHLQSAKILPYKDRERFRCFNNKEIKIVGVLQMDLSSGSWFAPECKILLVDNKTNNIMGRDNLRKLGITLTARKNEGKKMLHITDNTTETKIIKWILKKYPKLCTRLGKSKNHIAKPSMKENFKPVQQNGRRVPLHLLDKVEAELKKLIQDKQIIKLDKCSDEHFISPVVITVKHDKSVKIALDSKKLNDAIHKNKYQMQSIDHLIDEVATYISERKQNPGEFFFSKIDLKYAYSQIPLDPNIQKHCNFSILGGKATGTYRFINGFYGLTDMPATFQKTMDKTLESINTKFAFLDDILIITKGTLTEHEQELDKVLNLLDKENLAIKLQKCEFAKSRINMAGIQDPPKRNYPNKTKMRLHIQIRNTENTKTTTFVHGLHPSPHKIHPKPSTTKRTTSPTIIKKQPKTSKQIRLETDPYGRVHKN